MHQFLYGQAGAPLWQSNLGVELSYDRRALLKATLYPYYLRRQNSRDASARAGYILSDGMTVVSIGYKCDRRVGNNLIRL